MAREIPAAPRIYTTTYDNFRGVDFTNDPTNVWSHRSPNAKNMIPDLSGRPWKRTGWKIVKTAQDFKDVYNTTKGYDPEDADYFTGKVIPQKTSYFELGGEDYLAITNNLGLFIYSKFIGTSAADKPYLIFIDRYYGEEDTPSESTSTITTIAPDANRSFFFEGNGKAGFYIFCTAGTGLSAKTSLFRFDGEKLRIVDPYVPRLLIGTSPTEVSGTFYESPNMLTPERQVLYMGDGASVDYLLPEYADLSATFKVEIRSGTAWAETSAYTTSDYVYGGKTVTKVTFSNAPASETEDNVRITYSIAGGDVSTKTLTFTYRIGKGTKTVQTRTLTYVDGALETTTPWVDGATTNWDSRCKCAAPNLLLKDNKPDIKVYLKTDADNWTGQPILDSMVDATYTSYTNSLLVFVPNPTGYYYTEVTEYSTPTELSSNVSTNNSSGSGSSGEIHAMGSVTSTVTTVTQQRTVSKWKYYPIKIEAQQRTYSASPERNAFEQCIRSHVYGDGIINSVFMTGSTADAYKSRVWWSAVQDPSYFPDTNYFEAGSNDTKIAGLIKVGEYLGVIKQGQSTDSTIYLAYPTKIASGSITEGKETVTTYDDTFAVKSSIGGVGAVSNGAFNILNGEPLFLSKNGVMGIVATNENEKQIRNRSFYINKKLIDEGNLESAFSFVWRNMYILALNNHCYVLDGSQKSSWANEKTNLQYECYYWDNVPAQCFARYDEELWFTDHDGRLCRFKPEGEPSSYHDDYDSSVVVDEDNTLGNIPVSVIASNPGVKVNIDLDTFWSRASETGQYVFTFGSAGYLHRTLFGHHFGNSGHLDVSDSPRSGDSIMTYLHDSEGWHLNGDVTDIGDYGLTIEGEPKINDVIMINVGCPILAKWTTVLDDDGSAHYFKTLQKKGTMVVLYPQSSTGVRVYIKRDNEAEMYVGTATVRGSNNDITAPSDFYLKKKAKKYKRLQIIAENDGFDETFGIDEIIKCYTVGNYSRNR